MGHWWGNKTPDQQIVSCTSSKSRKFFVVNEHVKATIKKIEDKLKSFLDGEDRLHEGEYDKRRITIKN